MVSTKVRKQTIFVSACRRRLKKMMIENGDGADGEEHVKKSPFPQMVEHLRECMDSVKTLRAEIDKLRKKKDAAAATKRHEYNTEIHRAKGILRKMRESLAPLQKEVQKLESKGKTSSEKYIAKKRDFNHKDELIINMYTELEKLEFKDTEFSAKEAEVMDDANNMVRQVRRARREEMMKGALCNDDAGPPPPEEEDPDFDAKQQEIAQNRKEQEIILGRILNGLGTLKEQALNIGDQIDQSNEVLETMDKRADVATDGLQKLNKATLRALQEASNQSCFTNIACFLLLIALVGVAVYYLDLV